MLKCSIDYDRVLMDAIKEEKYAPGKYEIRVHNSSSFLFSPMPIVAATFTVDQEGKIDFKYRESSLSHQSLAAMVVKYNALNLVSIVKLDEVITYYYFDNDFDLQQTQDMQYPEDIERKKQKNYFPADKYKPKDLTDKMNKHIISMRDKILASFKP